MSKIKFDDIPKDKTIEDYPKDTVFVLDEPPRKLEDETKKEEEKTN